MALINQIVYKNELLQIPSFSAFKESDKNYLDEQLFINYLEDLLLSLNIYDSNSSCFYNASSILEYFIQIDLINFNIKIANDLYKIINNCFSTGVRLIIIPIKLKIVNSRMSYSDDTDIIDFKYLFDEEIILDLPKPELYGGHSNLLIIDTFNKNIEFFEPHGLVFQHQVSSMLSIYNIIEKVTKNIFTFTDSYNFINSAQSCIIGPQMVQGLSNPSAGHCLAWSLLFILIRLLNVSNTSNNTASFIYEYLITIESKELDSFIRQFITFVDLISKNVKRYDTYNYQLVENYLNKESLDKIEIRLRYLLNIYFSKQKQYSTKDLEIIFEEIVSYRKLPRYQDIYSEVFRNFIINNCQEIIEEKKFIDQFELEFKQ